MAQHVSEITQQSDEQPDFDTTELKRSMDDDVLPFPNLGMKNGDRWSCKLHFKMVCKHFNLFVFICFLFVFICFLFVFICFLFVFICFYLFLFVFICFYLFCILYINF